MSECGNSGGHDHRGLPRDSGADCARQADADVRDGAFRFRAARSGQVAPNFWLNWANGVNYSVGVQTPQYRVNSLDALLRTPVSAASSVVTSTNQKRWLRPPWPHSNMPTAMVTVGTVLAIVIALSASISAAFWTEMDALARARGVRVAIEMHPHNLVFSPVTLRKLVDLIGAASVGAEMDPSHLMWQGMDVVACIRWLGPLVFHAAAKDAMITPGGWLCPAANGTRLAQQRHLSAV